MVMASPWSPGSDKVFWDISGEQFEADSIDGDRGITEAQLDTTADTSVASGDAGTSASGKASVSSAILGTAVIPVVAATERPPVLRGASVTSVGSAVADDMPAAAISSTANPNVNITGADVSNAEERCQTPDSLDHAISDKKFGN